MMCQIAFVNYLPHFVNYGIYGAVGGMMLLLLWVYFSGIIIILGACLCAAIEQCREKDGGRLFQPIENIEVVGNHHRDQQRRWQESPAPRRWGLRSKSSG